ncbi:PURINE BIOSYNTHESIS PROTEIN 6/7 PUR6/7 [Salix purpurea]|uniref:phosphoribosylaminoimidazole carboxylase n=1 Tax=Salix purpurea TaxID=77065 RepID=A0A9Q0W941_SALPP|nr:PURINE BIOSYNTHESIS PROTEIN 6/7 PUR6/7 [Salix purpurea]
MCFQNLIFVSSIVPPLQQDYFSWTSTPNSSSSSSSLKQSFKQYQSPVLACHASTDTNDTSLRKDYLPVHGVSEVIVGVLGGGQLGRMLCQAASEMAIKVMVLDPLVNCPASSIAYDHMVGSFDDSETVHEFAKRCAVLTVEIEHVDVGTMEKLEQQGVDCQPKASTIRIIQSCRINISRKVHFSRHGIPLPDFMQVPRGQVTYLGYPLMLKSRRLAYDGRGNAVAKNDEELTSAVNALGGFARGLYVEKWTPFVKELAVIVGRGRDNSISCYPVVETIHKENICHVVKGSCSLELFLTKDGQVLLNEVAPRPHNSGHHTIESCYTSQFEQHLRAVLGLPLGDPSMKTPAAIMYNLLGEDEGEPGFHLAHQLIGRALNIQGTAVHWYDKPVEAQLKSMLKDEGSETQTAVSPCVGIIMGSDSDLPIMKDAAMILNMFGVPHEVRIVSAHRTPEMMFSYALSARERGIQIIIAGAGGAAHLPGMVASLTPLPIIGVPVRASALDGMDSLLSIVQMPRGVPVATVAINNATNAGLLAVRMLGVGDADLAARMSQYQEDTRDDVLKKGRNTTN